MWFYLLTWILSINSWDKNAFHTSLKDKGILFNYFERYPNKIFSYLKNVCISYSGNKIKLCKKVKNDIRKLYKKKNKQSIKQNIWDINIFCSNSTSENCKQLKKIKKYSFKILKKKYKTKKNWDKLWLKKCSLKHKPKYCMKIRKLYMSKYRKLVRKPFKLFDHLEKTCNFKSENDMCKIGYYLLLKWVNRAKNNINLTN